MATFHDRTFAPKFQAGLLGWASAHSRNLVPNAREIPGSCPAVAPLADPESTAPQPCNASGLATEEALASTALAALLEPPEAAEARTLHMRRELRKGLDYGLALMDALDLSARGLDLMHRAIAQLDALDAPDEDLEPNQDGGDEDEACDYEETSLETFGRGFVRCGADDAEDDDPTERDDEHGSEDETHPWRCDPSLVAIAVQVAHG